MHKTIYIDVDEEIIGIINKIRNTENDEVFLVVPKNSLLTQGIVNLKLLKKEVAKMKKRIILVTSDQHSRRIIKRVGLETKSKSVQDFVSEDNEPNKEKPTQENSYQKIEFEEEYLEAPQKNNKREIGSSDFYDYIPIKEKTLKQSSPDTPDTEEMVSPVAENKKLRVNSPNTFGSEHIENYEAKKNFLKKPEKPKLENKLELPLPKKETMTKPSIDDFYQKNLLEEDIPPMDEPTKKPGKRGHFAISNKKRFSILLVLLLLFLLIPVGIWFFSMWPKMTVELFLKENIKETQLSLKVCDEKTAGDDCLKGDYQELIVEVTRNYDSSGEKFSNDKGMARGVVKIYNNYSSQNQPLVEKTRLLSSDGKLFRLIKGVTVPGMKNDQPGVVEALVIADEIGQSYNIKPTEFTIEGFKGNEKYEKFKAVSESDMTGGANDIENKKVKVVTESDIDTAREKTIEAFNSTLEENIQKQLTNEETFVVTSVDKEIISSDSSYAPGDIIDKFNYIVKEKIKLITFNKNDFESLVKEKFESEVSDDLTFEKISQTDFQKDVANYETKTLDLTVTAKAIYWPTLETDEIEEQLVNKNNEEVRAYLEELNQIKKALITYKPAWLSTLPIQRRNISIVETK